MQAKSKLSKYIQPSILIAFWINFIGYCLAIFTAYISPKYCFFFTYLSLAFVPLFLGILFWLFLSFFYKKVPTLLIILAIVLGYKNIQSSVGFSFKNNNTLVAKKANVLRVLSWNVNNFISNNYIVENAPKRRHEMNLFIKKVNADVLCFQDFENTDCGINKNKLEFIKDSLGYPYYYFSIDHDSANKIYRTQYGTIVFSKYPIVNKNRFPYKGKYFIESLAFADIIFNNKPIRFYNTHLKSMYLNFSDTESLSQFAYKIEDSILVKYSSKLTKLKRYDTAHVAQAIQIKKTLDTTSIPYVFCADANSVPSSYVYHYLSKNLSDAFLKNSFGFSQTFDSKINWLRIDLLLGSQVNFANYYNPKLPLSNHFPIVSDIEF
jgi:endonuclease/exonuclease/phosphatase family metal-dependent hydrolase